jgi:hypothetical protein
MENYQTYLPIDMDNPVNRDFGLGNGLVAWWLVVPSIMGGGTWYDLLQLSHGSLMSMGANAGWRSSFRSGSFGSLLFNQTNSFVQVVDDSRFRVTNFTICAWINPISFANFTTVLQRGTSGQVKNNAYAIASANSGGSTLSLQLGDGTNSQIVNWNMSFVFDGTWKHIAATVDGTTLNLYVNGKLDRSVAQTVIPQNGVLPAMLIGAGAIGPQNFIWNGNLDDIRIYNNSLNAVKIRALYDNSLQGCPNLLTRVPFFSKSNSVNYFYCVAGNSNSPFVVSV